MNARETLEKAVKVARGDIQKNWADLSERDRDTAELGVRRVIAAGFTIMSKEDVEAIRTALEEAKENIAHWGSYASKYFQEKHRLEADIAIAAAIRKLKSGGSQPR